MGVWCANDAQGLLGITSISAILEKIVSFACVECRYASIDKQNTLHLQYNPNSYSDYRVNDRKRTLHKTTFIQWGKNL